MSHPASYPIRAVARMTGVSVDTLRAWERRYQAVVPERGERGRVYRESHVARLRQLDALVRRGHAIGTIAQLSDRQLGRLLRSGDALEPASRPTDALDLAPLIDALDTFALADIDATLNRFATLLAPAAFITQVALPLLRELGQRWASGKLRPSQEHLVSSIVRTVLGGLLRTAPPPSTPGAIVFATPAGERHELGALAAAVLAAQAGFAVVYLGPDLPPEEIAAAADAANAAAIVVGATVTTPGAQLVRLERLAPKCHVIVGGPHAARALRASSQAHRVSDLSELVPLLRTLLR